MRRFYRMGVSDPFPPMCDCRPINKSLIVQQNLAVTPAQMMSLTEKGIAISTQTLQYDEGSLNPSNIVPIDARRGVDVNDVWQASETARKKLVNAHKSDIAAYD